MSYVVQKVTPLAGWQEVYRASRIESAHDYIRKQVARGRRFTAFRIREIVLEESLKEVW